MPIPTINVSGDVFNALLPQKNLLNMAGDDLKDGSYSYVEPVKPRKKTKTSLKKVSDDNFRMKFRFKNDATNKLVTVGIGALLFMRTTDDDASENFEPSDEKNENLPFVHEFMALEAQNANGNTDSLNLPNHFKVIHAEDKTREIDGEKFTVYPSYAYKALQDAIKGKDQAEIDKVFSNSDIMMNLPATEELDSKFSSISAVQNLTVKILS